MGFGVFGTFTLSLSGVRASPLRIVVRRLFMANLVKEVLPGGLVSWRRSDASRSRRLQAGRPAYALAGDRATRRERQHSRSRQPQEADDGPAACRPDLGFRV